VLKLEEWMDIKTLRKEGHSKKPLQAPNSLLRGYKWDCNWEAMRDFSRPVPGQPAAGDQLHMTN